MIVFRQVRVLERECGLNINQSTHVKLFEEVLWEKIWSHLDLEWDLQTRARILLAAGFSIFTLDIQNEISWASVIEIRQFKNPNSSTNPGLQLSWRTPSQIMFFKRTEYGRNWVGWNGSLDMIQKLMVSSIPIWLRVWHKM